jgi:TolB-like protein/Flp pilus assembly protein TadD
MTASPDIFLSYNREDAAIAKAYAEAFAREGLNVWWDATLRSGEAYDKVTEVALRGAKAVVVLWSPRSVESRWVRAEATIADRNGTLMPVTIESCNRPVMFELTQTAELSNWRGEANDETWLAFLDDVRRMVGRGEPKAVEAASNPARGQVGAPAKNGKPIAAVLPITHRVGGEDMEFLAEDLTEEITRELAQSAIFGVIAARTMTAWRGKAVDYRALGARYLIEGKLQRVGEEVRLTVQLIDTATGSMLWSARIARMAAEIDAAPEEFPVAVAYQLDEQITQIEIHKAMTKPGPFSGWEHCLRAMAYTGRMGSDSLRRAIEEAREAIAAAPDLGFAHAMLGALLAGQAEIVCKDLDDTQRREIQAHIQRALQLDGDNPTIISGLVLAFDVLGDGETGLRLARRGVELYPNSPRSYSALGLAYITLGRTTDAIAAFKRQDRSTPFDRHRYVSLMRLGMSYLLEGQPDEAEAAIDRSLGLHPNYHVTLIWKAIVAARRGKEPAAIAVIRRLREVEPAMSIDQHVWQIDHNPHLAERTIEAVAILRRLWADTGGDA